MLEHHRVKQAHIVSHSYGCRVAVELALNSPEIVATLTFADHPQARANLDARLPKGWYETALADLDGFFEVELPTRAPFGEHEASQLTMPSLAVGGTESLSFFRESYTWLIAHLPGVEGLELTGATHWLQLDDPTAFAAGLSAFLDRHPIHP